MRIAISGTHGVGKTTLAEDLASHDRRFELVPEPSFLSPADTAFYDGPNTEDLTDQLEQSCDLLLGSRGTTDLVFDRSPLDFIAYLDVTSATEGFEWEPSGKQLARAERALKTLDLLVFVPLLKSDEILGHVELPALRRKVNARLTAMIDDDELGLFAEGLELIRIFGPRPQRVARLMARLAPGA